MSQPIDIDSLLNVNVGDLEKEIAALEVRLTMLKKLRVVLSGGKRVITKYSTWEHYRILMSDYLLITEGCSRVKEIMTAAEQLKADLARLYDHWDEAVELN